MISRMQSLLNVQTAALAMSDAMHDAETKGIDFPKHVDRAWQKFTLAMEEDKKVAESDAARRSKLHLVEKNEAAVAA